MTQALYRKWRPRRWEAVVGQDHVIQTLRNAVKGDRVAHAYLFAGPRGTGKTTTARLLAKAVNCLDPDPAERPCDRCEYCLAVNEGRFLDLIEIDAASNTSVDDVRDLRDKINFSPNQGRYKVYVVDEVHMLSTAAFNALLKTLEEPPPHAIFILATTEVHKVPATVLSRCQRHEFRRIPVNEIVTSLEQLASQEGLKATREALFLIARQSTGSLRDAISLLDQLASIGQEITIELVHSMLGTAPAQAVIEVVNALAECEPGKGIEIIHAALDTGSDPRQFARQIVEYLRGLLLLKVSNLEPRQATVELRQEMNNQVERFNSNQLLRDISLFNRAATDTRAAWQPSLPLEVAMIEACQNEAGTISESPPARPTHKAGNTAPGSSANEVNQRDESLTRDAEQQNQATQALNKHWQTILSLVRQKSPNTYGLLNSCRTRFVSGREVILGFASDILKNQMSKKENLTLVQSVISQVMQEELTVRCIINLARSTEIPPGVDDDGMVAAALRDLGGEIVDIQ